MLLLTGGAFIAAGCPLVPLSPPPACSRAGCDDANGCTIDRCDEVSGRCLFEPLPQGTVCDHDNDACNGVDRCDETGQCQTGSSLTVDDGNACTTDLCDLLTGVISHLPISGCGLGSGGSGGTGSGGSGGGGGAEPAPPIWTPLATEGAPSPRRLHTAVWTGTKMLVWGGLGKGGVTNTGAAYDPATDTWKPLAVANAPTSRHSHSAVWTGSEMIVWGGFSSNYEATGGRYDPLHDVWTPLPFTTIKGRARHVTVWTGGEMIVWGGSNGLSALGDGARYTLGSNAWSVLPGGGPSARFNASAVWTGSMLAIWGGTDTFDWFADGRYLSPTQNTWTNISTANRPGVRESSSIAWTGAAMLLWSGWNGGDYMPEGYTLRPAVGTGGTWAPIDVSLAPAPRAQGVTIWTGSELCVWGGCGGDACADIREDGGCFSMVENAWRAIPSEATFPGRVGPTAVWTNTEFITFGGHRHEALVAGGGRLSLEALPP